jgi:hypothetical protein
VTAALRERLHCAHTTAECQRIKQSLSTAHP